MHVVVQGEGHTRPGRYDNPGERGRNLLPLVGLEGDVHRNRVIAGVLHQDEGLHAPGGAALGQVPGGDDLGEGHHHVVVRGDTRDDVWIGYGHADPVVCDARHVVSLVRDNIDCRGAAVVNAL